MKRTKRNRRMRAAGVRTAFALACMLAIAGERSALGTPTDPTLALFEAAAARTPSRTRVRVAAVFPQADLVQIAYPLQLLIRDAQGGAQYLRFDLVGGAFAGSQAALSDGVDATEALALLAEGSPTNSARLLLLGDRRIEVGLPPSFPTADMRALLFVEDAGTAILSNEVPVAVVVGSP